jgi:hypothetical protein
MGQSRPATSDEIGAVVLVADCTAPGAATIPRIFRNALKGAGMSVLSEAETAAPFGGLSVRSTAELKQALADARDDFLDGQVVLALQSLQRLSGEVDLLAPSPERWELQRNVLTNLAQVLGRSDKSAAQAVLIQILSVEPDYKPDPSVFPPSFIAQVKTLQHELKRKPASELQVTTEPAETGIVVGGRPMGLAPMSVPLPPGLYRLEGMWGYRGLTKSVDVGAPSQPAVSIVLSTAREGSIAPDAGPCLLPVPTREAALARFAALLKVKWVYAIRSETSGNTQRLVAEQFDAATGHTVREEWEAVVSPDSGSQTAARLAVSLTSRPGAQAIPRTDVPVVNTGLRTWSYVVGAFGVAATTAGLIFYFSGNSKIQTLYSQYAEGNNFFPPNYESTFQSQNDSARTSKTVGVVLVGVGVAALATGVGLFFVSASGGRPDSVTAFGPSLLPGGGGAVVSGRF